jgi:hypothetical protein
MTGRADMKIRISSKLAKELKKAYSEQFGVPVYQGTPYCRNRLKSKGCLGCESEEGCIGFRKVLGNSLLIRCFLEEVKNKLMLFLKGKRSA